MNRRTAPSKRYAEIAVSVGPRGSTSPDEESRRSYEAVVYSDLPELQASPPRLPEGYATELGGLPVVARESITIRWPRYDEYVKLFQISEKDPHPMRERLIETMSPGLGRIVTGGFSGRPVRVWWHTRTPELDELPWELLALRPRGGGARVSFVRGLPAEHVPRVPLRGDMQLLVIGNARASSALRRAWQSDLPGVQVMPFDGGLRLGLRRAVAERVELVHVIGRGSLSLGFDPIVECGEETLAPGELHALLDGSRVTIVAFSPDANLGERARATYAAFSHLGGGASNTTLVAPIGPMSDEWQGDFWYAFYRALPARLSVERALWEAHREATRPAPVAVYLRHRQGVEFARDAPGPTMARVGVPADAIVEESLEAMPTASTSVDPVQLDARVRADREFLAAIDRLRGTAAGAAAGAGAGMSSLKAGALDAEKARLDRAEAVLDRFLVDEGDADE